MGGDRGNGGGERREALCPFDSAPPTCPVPEKNEPQALAPASPSSGVFERVPAVDGQSGCSAAGLVRALPQPGPERVSVDNDSSIGRALMRLFGSGAAAVVIAPVAPDVPETAEKRGQFTVELRAVSAAAAAGLVPAQPLMEIRAVPGRPGLYVRGQRIRFGGNEKRLLDYLLESPALCAANDDIEQLLWPRQRGDLGARRRELVSRMNAKLKEALGLDDPESNSPLPIESSEHSTHINLDVCKVEREKV